MAPARNCATPVAQSLLVSGASSRLTVNIGVRYCQSHAFPCDLQEAHMTGDGVWKVKFKVRGPGEGGHVHLDIDARNGAMLRVDEKVHGGGHGH